MQAYEAGGAQIPFQQGIMIPKAGCLPSHNPLKAVVPAPSPKPQSPLADPVHAVLERKDHFAFAAESVVGVPAQGIDAAYVEPIVPPEALVQYPVPELIKS